MHYIIDGYNVINHPSFACARKKMDCPQLALLDLIKSKRLCGSRNNQVTVVFDGYSAEIDSICADREIKVIFSREETADEKIKKIIDNSGNMRNIVVVSDDKEIVYFAKYAGCKPMGINEFMGRLAISDERKKIYSNEKNLSKQDLNYNQIKKINDELKKIWLSDT